MQVKCSIHQLKWQTLVWVVARNTCPFFCPLAFVWVFFGYNCCSLCPTYMKFEMKVHVIVVDIEVFFLLFEN